MASSPTTSTATLTPPASAHGARPAQLQPRPGRPGPCTRARHRAENDVDQLTALEPSFDFAVNEQCGIPNAAVIRCSRQARVQCGIQAELCEQHDGARDQLCTASKAAACARAAAGARLPLQLRLSGSTRGSPRVTPAPTPASLRRSARLAQRRFGLQHLPLLKS